MSMSPIGRAALRNPAISIAWTIAGTWLRYNPNPLQWNHDGFHLVTSCSGLELDGPSEYGGFHCGPSTTNSPFSPADVMPATAASGGYITHGLSTPFINPGDGVEKLEWQKGNLYLRDEPALPNPDWGPVDWSRQGRYQKPDDHPNPFRDPMQLPIGVPVVDPRPLPYRLLPHQRPNPWRDPAEQPRQGNGPSQRLRPRGRIVVPSEVIPVEPGKPVPKPKPEPYSPAKPPPGTKERKMIVTIAGTSFIGRLVNVTTESVDLINAVYEGLPSRLRRRGLTPQAKLRAVYDHLDEWDPWAFAQAFAMNQIEDMVFGRIGRIGARASRRLGEWTGRPVGIQTGPLF